MRSMARFADTWVDFYNKMAAIPDDERTTTTISKDRTLIKRTGMRMDTVVGSLKVSADLGFVGTMSSSE